MTFSRTTIDGLNIHYRRQERSGAPTLLMTNAWPLSIRCWDAHWDALSQHFSLLAYDMPGFGLSEGRAAHMTPSAQAAFALKLMDHFQVDRVHGVGPDVGVPAMLSLAENHPERLHSITIFNGPGTYPPVVSWEIKAIVASAIFRQVTGMVGPLFAREAIRRGYRRHKLSSVARAEYEEVNALNGNFRHTLSYLGSYPTELSLIEGRLSDIKVPVLILWGDKDPFIRVANAHILHKRIPSSKLHIFQGCGHFSHEDAGSLFTDKIREWVATSHQRTHASLS